MIGSRRIHLTVLGFLISMSGWSAPLPPVKEVVDLSAKARALEARLPAPKLARKETFELSPQRQERLSQRLPQTFRRASQREPLHLLVLGNAGAFQMKPEEGKSALMDGFPGIFARELASQFFYTGGVHEAGSKDESMTLNTAITLRLLEGSTGNIQEAAAILGSAARQAPVNLVLLCYGQDEAQTGMSPVTFLNGVKQAVDAAEQIGAEVILCSPWLSMSGKPEASLGISRSLADAVSELAEKEGLVYADLGDLARLLELPHQEDKNEGLIFERFMTAYRGFFYETAEGSFVPRASLHQRLGVALIKGVMDGASPCSFSLTEVSASWSQKGSGLELKATVINRSQERLHLTLLPLIVAGWKPLSAQPQMLLPAGGHQEIIVSYGAADGQSAAMQEADVRLPVLMISGSHARVLVMRSTMKPVSVVWGMETLFNQDKRWNPTCQIFNATKTDQRGEWMVTWRNQKQEGRYDLKAGATQPLDLGFNLAAVDPSDQVNDLMLTLTGESFRIEQTQEMTLTQNLGLKHSVALKTDKGASGTAHLRVEADTKTLTFIVDLQGAGMLQSTARNTAAAWQLEVCMDARSYGKRLESGSTAPVTVTGSAQDGPGHVKAISPWAFGTGYAANFDSKQFQAGLSSQGSEHHEIRLTLPRSYLYLHEWALDNGNSQLGLSLNLTLHTASGYRTWSLNPTSKQVGSIESLVVLELSEKSTGRFTVDVHSK